MALDRRVSACGALVVFGGFGDSSSIGSAGPVSVLLCLSFFALHPFLRAPLFPLFGSYVYNTSVVFWFTLLSFLSLASRSIVSTVSVNKFASTQT